MQTKKRVSHNQKPTNYRKMTEKELAKKAERKKQIDRAMAVRSQQATVTVRGKGGTKKK